MDNPDNPRERPSCHISERPDKGVHTPRQDLVFLMGYKKRALSSAEAMLD